MHYKKNIDASNQKDDVARTCLLTGKISLTEESDEESSHSEADGAADEGVCGSSLDGWCGWLGRGWAWCGTRCLAEGDSVASGCCLGDIAVRWWDAVSGWRDNWGSRTR